MTISNAEFRRRAGVLATGKVWRARSGEWRYQLRCKGCPNGQHLWTTSDRTVKGQGSTSYRQTMDQWVLHLSRRHPDALHEAPCVVDLAAAEARQVERLHSDAIAEDNFRDLFGAWPTGAEA